MLLMKIMLDQRTKYTQLSHKVKISELILKSTIVFGTSPLLIHQVINGSLLQDLTSFDD